MQPLRWMANDWSAGLWTLVTLLMGIAACAVVVARLPRAASTVLGAVPSGARRVVVLTSLAAILLLISMPMVVNLWLGQVSMGVTLLVLLDAAGATPRRAQRCLIGLASALKLTPLIFIPYFVATRRWRQAAISAGTFAGRNRSWLRVLTAGFGGLLDSEGLRHLTR